MQTYTVNMIGCGRLGKTIGRLMTSHDTFKILGVCNTSMESSAQAVAFLNQGDACASINDLPNADIWWIAVPDDKIKEVVIHLKKNPHLQAGNIVLHSSGVYTTDILQALKKQRCLLASVHPVRSFVDPEADAAHFKGTHCALQGDPDALIVLNTVIKALGGLPFVIPKKHKALYHAASVIAHNYSVTLYHIAKDSFVQAGIEGTKAHDIVATLMEDALRHIKAHPSTALTGPIARGDIGSVREHMKILESSPAIQAIYALLGMYALSTVEHPSHVQSQLESVFLE